MPPRRSVAALASQSIGNVIAAAQNREIKLPPFEEDMPQAWYNQAEAYFRLHGVTNRMFWFYYVQWALKCCTSNRSTTVVAIVRNAALFTASF